MIKKSLADTKEWKSLMKRIEKANKNPDFKDFIKGFKRFHSGKAS